MAYESSAEEKWAKITLISKIIEVLSDSLTTSVQSYGLQETPPSQMVKQRS